MLLRQHFSFVTDKHRRPVFPFFFRFALHILSHPEVALSEDGNFIWSHLARSEPKRSPMGYYELCTMTEFKTLTTY